MTGYCCGALGAPQQTQLYSQHLPGPRSRTNNTITAARTAHTHHAHMHHAFMQAGRRAGGARNPIAIPDYSQTRSACKDASTRTETLTHANTDTHTRACLHQAALARLAAVVCDVRACALKLPTSRHAVAPRFECVSSCPMAMPFLVPVHSRRRQAVLLRRPCRPHAAPYAAPTKEHRTRERRPRQWSRSPCCDGSTTCCGPLTLERLLLPLRRHRTEAFKVIANGAHL